MNDDLKLLAYYIRLAHTAPAATWRSDNEAELSSAIEGLDAKLAHVDELEKRVRALEIGLNTERLLRDIIRHDLLEDRSEYDVEDLRLAYGLTVAEAEALRILIREAMAS